MIDIYFDIAMYGKTKEQHDSILLNLMKVAQEKGLVFNSGKYAICQPNITFSGCLFRGNLIRPVPAKVQGIGDMLLLMDIKQIQSFLSQINLIQLLCLLCHTAQQP